MLLLSSANSLYMATYLAINLIQILRIKTFSRIINPWNQLTLCPVCHQVHLAVCALPQLPYVLILFGYICCRQRGDGQGLHVLHRHPSTVAHLGCRRAPAAAHPSWPRWRKRQARLDAVGQTKWRGEKKLLRASFLSAIDNGRYKFYAGMCLWLMLFSIFISIGGHPFILVCTCCPKGWLNQEGFNRPSFPYNQFRDGINRGKCFQ